MSWRSLCGNGRVDCTDRILRAGYAGLGRREEMGVATLATASPQLT